MTIDTSVAFNVSQTDSPSGDFTCRNRLGRFFGLLSLLLLVMSSSCMQSDYEKLQGRWYNASMSIRFRKDGSVFLNSSSGPAIGRYSYQPKPVSSYQKQQEPNLTLEVVRNNVVQRLEFEVVMLSHNRIRLTYLGTPESAARPRNPLPQILRKEDPSNPSPTSTTVAQVQK